MEINQLKAVLEQSLSIRKGGVEVGTVSAFNEKLAAARVRPLPEEGMVKSFQVKQAEMVSGIEESKIPSSLSPESALAVQYGLARSVIGVDLIAKVAGTFSQGINKLVSMQ
jgi:type III secretion system YscI/HrpB-like protein